MRRPAICATHGKPAEPMTKRIGEVIGYRREDIMASCMDIRTPLGRQTVCNERGQPADFESEGHFEEIARKLQWFYRSKG